MIKPEEVLNCETGNGTKYSIKKWTCPICNEQKSTLFIDGEWCHGDLQAAYFYNEEHAEGCSTCILAL